MTKKKKKKKLHSPESFLGCLLRLRKGVGGVGEFKGGKIVHIRLRQRRWQQGRQRRKRFWRRMARGRVLNPQAPVGVYKPPLVYCRMGFLNTSPISRIAFEQKRGKRV